MSKDEGGRNSSFCEKPVRPRPRRLVDWINLTGAKRSLLIPSLASRTSCIFVSCMRYVVSAFMWRPAAKGLLSWESNLPDAT